MRTVPRSDSQRISYYQVHAEKWAQDPGAIGATPQQIADLQTKIGAANQALQRQRQARNAARSATDGLRTAMDTLSTAGSSLIYQIRAKARTGGTPVYTAAMVSAPGSGTPMPEPGHPYKFEFSLDAIGCLTLTWKCDNPKGSVGTIYQVWRSDTGLDGKFVYLGGSGIRKFVDATVPLGTSTVTYRIQAIRSTAMGEPATFSVHFGNVMPNVRPAKLGEIQIPRRKLAA